MDTGPEEDLFVCSTPENAAGSVPKVAHFVRKILRAGNFFA
jgi:hypothetical protein